MKKIGWVLLGLVTWARTCAGPFGLEEGFEGAGHFEMIIAILVIAMTWTVPMVWLTEKLGSTCGIMGGYVRWVELGAGKHWAVFVAWIATISAILEMVAYPLLFAEYAKGFVPESVKMGLDESLLPLVLAGFCVVLGCLVCRYPVRVLAMVSAVIFIAVTTSGLCATRVVHCAPIGSSLEHNSLLPFLFLMWNLTGYELPSTFGSEVALGKGGYRKSLLFALSVAVFTYVFAVGAAWVIGVPLEDVKKDGWGALAYPGFGWMMDAAGMCGAFALYTTTVGTEARVLVPLAEYGVFPKWLAKKVDEVPRLGVYFLTAISIALMPVGIEKAVSMGALFVGVGLLPMYVALCILAKLKEAEGVKVWHVFLSASGPLFYTCVAGSHHSDEMFLGANALLVAGAVVLVGVVLALRTKK